MDLKINDEVYHIDTTATYPRLNVIGDDMEMKSISMSRFLSSAYPNLNWHHAFTIGEDIYMEDEMEESRYFDTHIKFAVDDDYVYLFVYDSNDSIVLNATLLDDKVTTPFPDNVLIKLSAKDFTASNFIKGMVKAYTNVSTVMHVIEWECALNVLQCLQLDVKRTQGMSWGDLNGNL